MKRTISPRRTCTAGPELSIDHTDYLVTILANQKVIDVLQDGRAKGERGTRKRIHREPRPRAFHVIATLEAGMMLARVFARVRQASWRTRSSRWTSAPSSHKLARASVKWVRPR
jgi:hypothetical protein